MGREWRYEARCQARVCVSLEGRGQATMTSSIVYTVHLLTTCVCVYPTPAAIWGTAYKAGKAERCWPQVHPTNGKRVSNLVRATARFSACKNNFTTLSESHNKYIRWLLSFEYLTARVCDEDVHEAGGYQGVYQCLSERKREGGYSNKCWGERRAVDDTLLPHPTQGGPW